MNKIILGTLLLISLFPLWLRAQPSTITWDDRYSRSHNYDAYGSGLIHDGKNSIYTIGAEDINGEVIRYNAGTGAIIWADTITYAIPVKVKYDPLGNVYALFTYNKVSSVTHKDWELLKYDTLGQRKWEVFYSDSLLGDDIPADFTIDSTGNIIVCGVSDQAKSASLYSRFTTIKFSPTGQILWKRFLSGGGCFTHREKNQATCIDLGSKGDVYVGGYIEDNCSYTRCHLAKYSSAGTLQWRDSVRIDPVMLLDEGTNHIKYVNGKVFLAGESTSTGLYCFNASSGGAPIWDFLEPAGLTVSGLFANSTNEIYLATYDVYNFVEVFKFSFTGTLLWRSLQPIQSDFMISSAAIDQGNNLYYIGSTGSSGSYILNLLQFDYHGKFRWVYQYPTYTYGYNEGSDVCVDNSGNIFTTGHCNLSSGASNFGSNQTLRLCEPKEFCSFTPLDSVSTTKQFFNIKLVDLNNDHFLDMIMSDSITNNIVTMIGTSTDKFTTGSTIPLAWKPGKITCADFNNDGFMDFITINKTADSIAVFLNNQSGGFAVPVFYKGGIGLVDLNTADFNLDRHTDIISASATSKDFNLLMNNGDGTFRNPVSQAANFGIPNAVFPIDLNNDSYPDLVVSATDGHGHMYYNDTHGNLNYNWTYAGTGPVLDYKIKDMNHDGFLDLVSIGSNGAYEVTDYHNLRTTSTTVTGSIQSAFLYDVNGDSLFDVVLTQIGVNKAIQVFVQDPCASLAFSQNWVIRFQTDPVLVAGGDVDNNGNLDIVGIANTEKLAYVITNPCQISCVNPVLPPSCGVSPTLTVTSTNEKSCIPGNEATAAVVASGGTGPYTYSWLPAPGAGQGSASVSALTAGTYTAFVSTPGGCTSFGKTIVSNPASPLVTVTSSEASCSPGSDGGAIAHPSGGKLPYTYSWSPAPGTGQGTVSAGGLNPGTYTMTLSDSNKCSVSQSVSITYANLPFLSFAIKNVSCYGMSDGKVKVLVTNGTSPFTYSWSVDPSVSDSIVGLPPETFTCSVVDSKGCNVIKIDSVIQPITALVTSNSASNISCNGLCDGTIWETPTGGTAPYSYSWSTSCAGFLCSNLCQGMYYVTVIDTNGCQARDSGAILEPAKLTGNLFSRPAHCFLPNGMDSVSVSGGTTPYYYSWSNGMYGSTTDTATKLNPGTYTVIVTDSNLCLDTLVNSIGNLGTIVSFVSQTNANCPYGGNGAATVIASNGQSPYTYTWTPVPLSGQGTNPATSLTPGSYTCSATDALGCGSPPITVLILQTSMDTISGTVTGTVSGLIQSGMVYLMRFDTTHGKIPILDSVSIQNGHYSFRDSIGPFIVYAVANPSLYPNGVRTYSAQSDQWINAQVIQANCVTADTGNIQLIEINPLSGTGTISGTITQGAGYVARIGSGDPSILAPGNPAVGVHVNLENLPGGIIASTTTDNAGNYSIGNIPNGSYSVWIDVPGLSMTKAYTRTITGSSAFPNLDYRIDSVHIYPDSLLITNTSNPASSSNNILVMPNPFNNEINIAFTLTSPADIDFEIYNLLGKRITSVGKKKAEAGYQRWTINLTSYDLAEGTYLLKGTVDGNVYSKRIIKLK